MTNTGSATCRSNCACMYSRRQDVTPILLLSGLLQCTDGQLVDPTILEAHPSPQVALPTPPLPTPTPPPENPLDLSEGSQLRQGKGFV